MEHTLGPWKWKSTPVGTGMDALIQDSEGFPLAHVIGVTNAPVMTAAPELLRIAQDLRQAYVDFMADEYNRQPFELPLCRDADQVISKATAALRQRISDMDNFDPQTAPVENFLDYLCRAEKNVAKITLLCSIQRDTENVVPMPQSLITQIMGDLSSCLGLVNLYVMRSLRASINDNPKLAQMTIKDFLVSSVKNS